MRELSHVSSPLDFPYYTFICLTFPIPPHSNFHHVLFQFILVHYSIPAQPPSLHRPDAANIEFRGQIPNKDPPAERDTFSNISSLRNTTATNHHNPSNSTMTISFLVSVSALAFFPFSYLPRRPTPQLSKLGSGAGACNQMQSCKPCRRWAFFLSHQSARAIWAVRVSNDTKMPTTNSTSGFQLGIREANMTTILSRVAQLYYSAAIFYFHQGSAHCQPQISHSTFHTSTSKPCCDTFSRIRSCRYPRLC
jgi:hypothetical protein